MSEIATLLEQKVGLSPDQAQSAESVLIEHLRNRVPSQFQGMLDQVLGAGSSGPADATQSGGVGGLLSEAESLLGSR